MHIELDKNAGIIGGIKQIPKIFKARRGVSAAKKGLAAAQTGGKAKVINYKSGVLKTRELEYQAAKENFKKHLFGQIKTPKQTAPKVKATNTKNTTAPTTTTAPTDPAKKYNWKHLAGAAAGGYIAPKLLGGSEQPQYYPKYASVSKLFKSIGNVVPSKGAEAVGKALVATTGIGLGGGLVAGYIAGDDGHDASAHGRKKTAEEMTPKEKADQKYAIAKSYEREGHEGKSEEYKDKASKAYKRAWEKTHGKSK